MNIIDIIDETKGISWIRKMSNFINIKDSSWWNLITLNTLQPKKKLLLSCRVGVVVCYVHPPGVTALEVSIQGSTVLGSNNMGDHKAQNHSPWKWESPKQIEMDIWKIYFPWNLTDNLGKFEIIPRFHVHWKLSLISRNGNRTIICEMRNHQPANLWHDNIIENNINLHGDHTKATNKWQNPHHKVPSMLIG